MAEPRQIVVVSPEPESSEWFDSLLGLGGVALLIGAAVYLARRRVRQGGVRHGRIGRVALASLVFGLGMVWMTVAEMAMLPAPPQDGLMMAAIAFPFGAVPAMLLFGLCEGVFAFFRPLRTRQWAMIGAASFAGAIAAGFGTLAAVSGDPNSLVSPVALEILGCAVAAAIIWWAELPPPAPDLAELFG